MVMVRRCENALRDAVLHAARHAVVVHIRRGLRSAAAPPPRKHLVLQLVTCGVR